MFEIPGSNINSVRITEDYVKGESGPVYDYSTVSDVEEPKTSVRVHR